MLVAPAFSTATPILAAVDTAAVLDTAQGHLGQGLRAWLTTTAETQFVSDLLPRAQQFLSSLSADGVTQADLVVLRDEGVGVIRSLNEAVQKAYRGSSLQPVMDRARDYFSGIQTDRHTFEALLERSALLQSLDLALDLPEYDTRYMLKGVATGAYICSRMDEAPTRRFSLRAIHNALQDLEIYDINPTELVTAWQQIVKPVAVQGSRFYELIDGEELIVTSRGLSQQTVTTVDELSTMPVADMVLLQNSWIQEVVDHLVSGGIGVMFTEDPTQLVIGIESLERNKRKIRLAYYGQTPLITPQMRSIGIAQEGVDSWAFPLIFIKN